jgi:large subunit ribosomal protein L10
MSNVIEQKKQVVDEIAEKLQASNSIVVVDYRGLNVAEVTELRKQLREAGIEFKVYKNTLTRRAVEKL